MVCTVEIGWLRTTLTIFRRDLWAETCCYAPKVWCFQSTLRFTSSPSLSEKQTSLRLFHCQLLLHREITDCRSSWWGGSLLSSHGWFTVLISRSHRSWPWGRTAVVTTTSWQTLWVIIRCVPPQRGGMTCCICRISAINSNLHAPSEFNRNQILNVDVFFVFFTLYQFLVCLFINHNMADRLNCLFPHKWMAWAINKQHSTFLDKLCRAAISLSPSEEGHIHLALRI